MKLVPAWILLAVWSGVAMATAGPTIELPADPPSRRTETLREVWRLGAEDDDVLLGVITFGVLNDTGEVLLVDRQLSQVLVIGPDGQLVTTLGREGEGPGELNQPHALLLLNDGAVGVLQGFPGRIIGLNADGTPAGDITFNGDPEEGGFSFTRMCVRAGDHLVASTGRMVFDMETGKARNTSRLAVYDLAGNRQVTIAEHTQDSDMTRQVFDEAAAFSELDQWAVAPDGTIYTAPEHDAYVLNVRDATGRMLRVLRRPFKPRRRSRAEKDELAGDVNVVMNGKRLEVENKALDTDPVFRNLAVANDGRLFVTNSYQFRTHLPRGTAGQFDIISPDGKFIEELTLLVPDFNGTQDVLIVMDGTHFLVLRNFEAAAAAMDNPQSDEDADPDEDGDTAQLEVIFLQMP